MGGLLSFLGQSASTHKLSSIFAVKGWFWVDCFNRFVIVDLPNLWICIDLNIDLDVRVYGVCCSVVGLNFSFVVLNLTKHTAYLIYNATLYFSSVVQNQYRQKYGHDQVISLPFYIWKYWILKIHVLVGHSLLATTPSFPCERTKRTIWLKKMEAF